jgi:hypothetical protein
MPFSPLLLGFIDFSMDRRIIDPWCNNLMLFMKKSSVLPSYEDVLADFVIAISDYTQALPLGDMPVTPEVFKDFQGVDMLFPLRSGVKLPDCNLDNPHTITTITEMTIRLRSKFNQIMGVRDYLKSKGERLSRSPMLRPYEKHVVANGFILPNKPLYLESLADRVQHVFCTKYERIPALSPDQIDHIIIDPAKVTDTQLRNLGIEPLPKGTSAIDRLRYAARTDVIEAIKLSLSNLNEITTIDEERPDLATRIHVVKEGPNKGKLLISRNQLGRKPMLTMVDVYGAVRQVDSIIGSYNQEIKELDDLKMLISHLDAFYMANKQDLNAELKAGDDGEKVTIYKQLILQCISYVRHCFDKNKENILQKLLSAIETRHEFTVRAKFGTNEKGERIMIRPAGTQKRISVAQNRAIWNSVPTEIEERKKRIGSIRKHIEVTDRKKIEDLAVSQIKPFERIASFFEEKMKVLPILNKQKLTGSQAAAARADYDRLIIRPLGGLLQKNFFLAPFDIFAKNILEQAQNAKAVLEVPKIDEKVTLEARKEFKKVYYLYQFLEFFHQLSSFYSEYVSSKNQKIDYQNALKEFIPLGMAFMMVNVGRDDGYDISEFKFISDYIIDLCEKITVTLEEMVNIEADVNKDDQTARKELNKKRNYLRDIIRKLDFAKLLKDV